MQKKILWLIVDKTQTPETEPKHLISKYLIHLKQQRKELITKQNCTKNFSMKFQMIKKNINNKISKNYFWYQTLSVLVKDLHESNQIKNNKILRYWLI